MKRIATLTLAMVMMTGITLADEITHTTEKRSATVTSEPVPSPPVQEHSSSSYRTEEKTSSTSDPLKPTQQETTTGSTIEERASTVVAPPSPVPQKTTIEKRSSTTTSE
jgi:hypothetical protein